MRLVLVMMLMMNLVVANSGKIALLIGNSDYSFQPLRNPLHDVEGIYKTLKEIGFDISQKDVLKNASQSQMQKALANFSQRAKNAEIALVYFSGHGMQVNNRNYMFPARTTATKPVDLFGLVDLDYFIQSASSAKYGIVLVDACRNNPLVKYFQNRKHKGSVAKKGLGQVTPTVGQVVIGFATSAGDTADDGNGRMSPYAKALSVRLKEPNKDITKVLGLVALDVSAKYEQNPMIRTNLAYDVCLSGDCNNIKVKIINQSNILSSKWITPKDNICTSNGGSTYQGCHASWSNAKKICNASGGRLPTLDEFKKVITDCGGLVAINRTDGFGKLTSKNEKNKSYQSCYKKIKFSKSNYWSNDTYTSLFSFNHNNAWVVRFEEGWVYDYTNTSSEHVRCIRAGE